MIFHLKKEKQDDSQINKMSGYSFFWVISGLFDDKNPFLLPYLHPRKLTNVPWKSMVGSDVFPIELVPWKRGRIVSFSGRVDHLVGISSQHHGKTYQILVSTKVRHHQSTKGSLQNGWLTHPTGSRGIFFGDFWGSWIKRCRFVILRIFFTKQEKTTGAYMVSRLGDVAFCCKIWLVFFSNSFWLSRESDGKNINHWW